MPLGEANNVLFHTIGNSQTLLGRTTVDFPVTPLPLRGFLSYPVVEDDVITILFCLYLFPYLISPNAGSCPEKTHQTKDESGQYKYRLYDKHL